MLLSDIFVQTEHQEDLSALYKQLSQPIVLAPPEQATDEEKEQIKRSNTLMKKCGITRIGDIIYHEPRTIRALVGIDAFNSICHALSDMDLLWNVNMEEWEIAYRPMLP